VKDKSTISACMIVKNEEKLLPQCLESIKDVVDEIIIVDTGSTDKTVEIAESYGAKIFHHPWENDFSKHRNQSISYAMGDWIFILDGDEEVIQWDDQLLTILKKEGIDSIHVKVENIYGKGGGEAWHNSIRLFSNNKRINYQGKVHNQLTGTKNSSPSSMVIYHRGYCLDPEAEEQKYSRTVTLLEQEIEKDPSNPKYHHYLAVAHLGNKFYDKALEEAEETLHLASKLDQEDLLYLWTRFVGAVCCININEIAKAERFCYDAIKISPLHIDSHYLLSSISYSQSAMKSFIEHSEKYLSLIAQVKDDPSEFGAMVHNTIGHEWRIRLHRGFALTDLGHKKDAERELSISINKCHDKGEYYKQRCLIHLNRSEYEYAERFFQKALNCSPEDEELLKLRSELQQKKSERKGDNREVRTRTQTDSPRISLCMIVKNEEKLLPQCLESIKDVVDEIIIVDTGSTDRTVEIAEKYTDKIYFHPWEEDFSKHRNQSISYATGEWIFILDADEVLSPESGKAILEAVKDESIDSIYATVKNSFDKSRGEAVHNSLRFFRNNGSIHYEGRVHNRVVGEKVRKIYPITIYHEGYNLPPEESRKKFIRTTTILKREIEENPQHPRAYHYLAASYLSEEMYDEALDSAMKAIELAGQNNFDDYLYLWSHFIAGLSYIKINRLDEAEKICLKAIGRSSKHLDSHYLLTVIYTNKKHWNKVFHHSGEYRSLLERTRQTPGEFGPMVHNTINHRWRVYLYRGFAFYETDEREKAEGELTHALYLCENKAEYFKLLALFYMETSELSKAERYLLEALGHNPEEKEKEKQTTAKLLGLNSDVIETLFSLANLYLKDGKLENSMGLYKKILESNKNHTGALINMGNVLRRLGAPTKAIPYLEEAVKASALSMEANSNLAYAYYDCEDYESARNLFQKTCQIDNDLEDIHLHLAIIDLKNMDLESCVFECDQVLRILGLARDEILNGITDLARKFLEIGERFKALQKSHLTTLACHLADELLQISTGNRNAMPA
jgi:glycosyltransferase involved in cell wall biosynthesis